MIFEMKNRFFKDVKQFTEDDAPDWLTSANQVPGSTMDSSWFWKERVLKLEVGQSLDTDSQTITRIH